MGCSRECEEVGDIEEREDVKEEFGGEIREREWWGKDGLRVRYLHTCHRFA